METIVERLMHWSEIRPQKIALQRKLPTGYERITYRELWEKFRTVAKELNKRGIEKERMTIVGRGFEDPIIPLTKDMTKEEKEEMARNRRVEFYLEQ